MSKATLTSLIASCLCLGCVRETRPVTPPLHTIAEGPWTPTETTSARFGMKRLGEVPNSGLQLPAVSPDGRWIALLEVGSPEPVPPAAMFSGKGLEQVSLTLRSLKDDGKERVVCEAGACWPAWSPDGQWLAFIVYNEGKCRLAVHDLFEATTKRIELDAATAAMPAFSPHGRQIALVVDPDRPGECRLLLLNPRTGETLPSPRVDEMEQVLLPQYASADTLMFLGRRNGHTCLYRWSLRERTPRRLYDIPIPAKLTQAAQAFAGIAQPLSPDGRTLAWYDVRTDRIVLLDISTGEQRSLKPRSRAGCWFGPASFVAATDKELLLAQVRKPERKNLLRGQWLPRWADPQTSQMLLLTRGSDPWRFGLLRFELLSDP